jgi:GT2 family glycosyltransferase
MKFGWAEKRSPSKWFDTKFYMNENKDVKELGIHPLEHYLLYGWKEDRDPCPFFNTRYYLDNNIDVKELNINPLLHFIQHGRSEGRKPLPEISQYIDVTELNRSISKNIKPSIKTLKNRKPIDIIIPVYNGLEYLDPLFKSIIKNTITPYRLLICDDDSPDKNVYGFLKRIKENNTEIDIVLIKNKVNLGFIGTVNKLVGYIENSFVLLNTDTEVPPLWLERLMYPIFNMDNVATTTPFTNAGTICSFPNYLEDNEILDGMTVSALDSYFQFIDFDKTYLEIPTGIGFCMGVNKNLVDEIGMFDIKFGKGYCEENDFCQRAIEKDYRNIHVTNLFVYHKHGGSFPTDEKKKFTEANLQILRQKYPTYDKQVQQLIMKDELKSLRDFIYFKIKTRTVYSTLIFDHNLGGGTNYYINEEIEKRIKEQQLICIIKFDFIYSKKYICRFVNKKKLFLFSLNTLNELFDFIQNFTFNEIFVNSLVSYEDVYSSIIRIKKLKEINGSKLIIPIHDYFPICPSFTLLNEKNKYCNIPTDTQICEKCLSINKGEFKQFENETDIINWRKNWRILLDSSDCILCFSNASREIFEKVYPNYSDKISVIPHDISGKYIEIYDDKIVKNKRVIGVLGGINEAKGAKVIEKMVNYIDDKGLDIKIVIIGEVSISIESSHFYCTGRYNTNEVPELVKKLEITQFLIPSIWPETFSYTTDEIIQMGYPLTVFNLGAPAERVKNYELGKVIEIEQLYKEFFERDGNK